MSILRNKNVINYVISILKETIEENKYPFGPYLVKKFKDDVAKREDQKIDEEASFDTISNKFKDHFENIVKKHKNKSSNLESNSIRYIVKDYLRSKARSRSWSFDLII